MASMPAEKRQTVYEAFLAVPPHQVAEIIHGELRTFPRPASRHARAATRLGMKLGGPFDLGEGDGPGGWILLEELELRMHGHILVPDLAGWRRERMPEMPDAPFFELAPDWVCEVLSPSTAATDRADKMPIYAETAVRHAWLVDPIASTLEAFSLEEGGWRVLGTWRGDARVRVPPFEAMELELASLWAR
jgi:Uma2 family endonuclease